jgi:uncharacterized protein YraI
MRKSLLRWLVPIFLVLPMLSLFAQDDLAAVMTVLDAGVEVQRVNTQQWIPVSIEAIVGVGDTIRTDDSGRALVTFFADGVETELEPNTTYRIDTFSGNDEQFTLTVEVLIGQTKQRLDRVLDAGSSYDVITPGASLVARGTVFDVRVEDDGRSGMIVSEGVVEATADDATSDVPDGFGVRADAGGELSDVVAATTFDQLDAALDGCTVALTTVDDVRINVRTGASTSFPTVGSVSAEEVTLAYGTVEGESWYRIAFRGGFGWILSSTATLQGECAGLRVFETGTGPEDASLYEFLGDPVSADDLTAPEATSDDETEANAEEDDTSVDSES